MRKEPLINEYGSNYGIRLIFDTYKEMYQYELDQYGHEGFPNNDDVWDQIRVEVLEPATNNPRQIKL